MHVSYRKNEVLWLSVLLVLGKKGMLANSNPTWSEISETWIRGRLGVLSWLRSLVEGSLILTSSSSTSSSSVASSSRISPVGWGLISDLAVRITRYLVLTSWLVRLWICRCWFIWCFGFLFVHLWWWSLRLGRAFLDYVNQRFVLTSSLDVEPHKILQQKILDVYSGTNYED